MEDATPPDSSGPSLPESVVHRLGAAAHTLPCSLWGNPLKGKANG